MRTSCQNRVFKLEIAGESELLTPHSICSDDTLIRPSTGRTFQKLDKWMYMLLYDSQGKDQSKILLIQQNLAPVDLGNVGPHLTPGGE
jgi:hypothetical protein